MMLMKIIFKTRKLIMMNMKIDINTNTIKLILVPDTDAFIMTHEDHPHFSLMIHEAKTGMIFRTLLNFPSAKSVSGKSGIIGGKSEKLSTLPRDLGVAF